MLDRRVILNWFCRLAGAGAAALVAIPGVRFLAAPWFNDESSSELVRRVCRLDDLEVDVPSEFVLKGSRRDAWTLYANEEIGRVWLVRRSDASVEPSNARVEAFSAVCPHLGCLIGFDSSKDEFACPCHKAYFELSGEAIRGGPGDAPNPSPRSMDSLECRIVSDEHDDAAWIEVTYERFELSTEAKTAIV